MSERTTTCCIALVVLLLASLCIAGCTTQQAANGTAANVTTSSNASSPAQELLVATTTSLYDTGLLDYLAPIYEKQYNTHLKITSQGSGKAIELAKRGDADVLLVHSPADEIVFMENGNGVNRRSFAYNYFQIVGPASDPAQIKGLSPEDAFKKLIAAGANNTANVAFVSRGDGSGTHSAEKKVWKNAGFDYVTQVEKSGNWYVEAGKGMGETLQMADQKQAYTLTDEGTFLAYKGNLTIVPVITSGASLLNIYSVMSVVPKNNATASISAANTFATFLTDNTTQQLIADFGKEKYGKGLFSPMNATMAKTFKVDNSAPINATVPMIVFHAGSLATPFKTIKSVFEKSTTGAEAELFSGSSITMIEKVTKNGEKADVVASADADQISRLMVPDNASFTLNFARNAMVLAYTNNSTGAATITKENWYSVLSQDNVKLVTGEPSSDPGGYRAYMTLVLAESYYKVPDLFKKVVSDHSAITVNKTGTNTTIDLSAPKPDNKNLLIPTATGPTYMDLLKSGKADYALVYRSSAVDGGVPYIELPDEISLANLSMSSAYASVQAKTPSGLIPATPIVYGVTIPTKAAHPDLGAAYIKALASEQGAAALNKSGLTPLTPMTATGTVPDSLKSLVSS
ncbi:extracellular solute-binding protein [Methanosphaerula subterraneus]|uniref:extracellular solute-binding protein n=1 Tax=Methanosphaerula subterraneus TaxID=3350244 RepID=UPI003F827073